MINGDVTLKQHYDTRPSLKPLNRCVDVPAICMLVSVCMCECIGVLCVCVRVFM